MKTYKVTYKGCATRFKNLEKEVLANSKSEAVEDVYSTVLDENYFPQEDGAIKDCSGGIIADKGDSTIEYDGGCFTAEEIEVTYVIQDGTSEYPRYYSTDGDDFGGDIDFATHFESEKEAQEVINKEGWREWAIVLSFKISV